MNALTVINPAASMAVPEVERVALAIAKGGLFGSTDANAVLTLCFLAQAEGQHPAVVFRDYHIIKGKPAKKADAMLRDFVSAGGKVEWHKLDDTIADATFSHPGGGSVRIDWTMDRAKQAGLATDMWRKYPRQMLRSRVISEGVRTVYPGATSGLYEVGEVQDMTASGIDNPAPAPAQRAQEPANHAPEPRRDDPVGEALADHEPAAREPRDPSRPSKTKVWAAVRNLDREMRSCGDVDQLECLMALDDTKALIRECEDRFPFLLTGGEPAPAEFEGLLTLETRLRNELLLEQVAGELIERNPVLAG